MDRGKANFIKYLHSSCGVPAKDMTHETAGQLPNLVLLNVPSS